MQILVINPGNTSTKLSIYDGEKEMCSQKIEHSVDDLRKYITIFDQYEYRMELVWKFMEQMNINPNDLKAVVGRGGLVRPIPCGTYIVNDQMIADLRAGLEGHHASNLGPALAKGIADDLKIPAYIVDPITVDELDPVARITGMPEIHRESRLHTLNQKAVGRKVAKALGKCYEELNFVICHLGTGISIAAHKKGRVVDMCDTRGEGPMSLDRCGGVNTFLVLKHAGAIGLSQEDFIRKMYTNGGLYAHLGTKDVRQVKQLAITDEKAALVLNTMIYQCAKEIGAQAAALSGRIDRIIITGGIAYDEELMSQLSSMVEFIAPVVIMPGEEEMEALAMGALRVLTREETVHEYNP